MISKHTKAGYLPDITVNVTQNGFPVDLSAYDGAQFFMRKKDDPDTVIVDHRPAEIIQVNDDDGKPVTSQLKYTLESGETDTPGQYEFCFALLIGERRAAKVPGEKNIYLDYEIIE